MNYVLSKRILSISKHGYSRSLTQISGVFLGTGRKTFVLRLSEILRKKNRNFSNKPEIVSVESTKSRRTKVFRSVPKNTPDAIEPVTRSHPAYTYISICTKSKLELAQQLEI